MTGDELEAMPEYDGVSLDHQHGHGGPPLQRAPRRAAGTECCICTLNTVALNQGDLRMANQTQSSDGTPRCRKRRQPCQAGRRGRDRGRGAVLRGAARAGRGAEGRPGEPRQCRRSAPAKAAGRARPTTRPMSRGDRAVDAAGEGYEMAHEHLNDALSQAETFARERPALAMGLGGRCRLPACKYMTRR